MNTESTPSAPPVAGDVSDTVVAVRNGVRLAASLLATWTVALVVRFQLPRYLGPEAFGRFNFADAVTGAVFSLQGLGISTYIMKEIPVRPKLASDFFGGLLALRLLLGALSLLGIPLVLGMSKDTAGLTSLVVAFGIVHLVTGINSYLASMLQAATKVNALAGVNVVAKLIWGGGLLVALFFGAPLYVLALPNLAAELLKLVVLFQAARSAIDLRLRIDVPATKLAVIASLPFFANGIAVELGYRIDITMLTYMAPGAEVGWYSAANNFAALAMLISPVIGWVVMPLLARARERSTQEFFSTLRDSIRAVLVLAIPGAMMIALGADFLVGIAFGSSYLPAIHAVRMLAPMFVATYLAILLSVALVILQRSWTLTIVSFLSLALEVVFVSVFVLLLRGRSDGTAASGAAAGLALAECGTVVLLLVTVGREALDRPNTLSVAKCCGVALLTALLHWGLRDLGPWRLLLDMVAYCAGVLLVGAVRPAEIRTLVGMLRERRAGGAS